jgi:hypothetical protein
MTVSIMPIFGPWMLCSSRLVHSIVTRMLQISVCANTRKHGNTYESMSPSTFVKKLVSFSESIFRLSPKLSSWSMMTVDADMLVARTLSPKSCTAILASASSRDRGITFSEAYINGSNCFAMPATFAMSGINVDVHGCRSSHDTKMVAIVVIMLARDRVKYLIPLAKVVMVSSMGAVRNNVSPRIAKRTTAWISVCYARSAQIYLHPSCASPSS